MNVYCVFTWDYDAVLDSIWGSKEKAELRAKELRSYVDGESFVEVWSVK